jgi:hypothetical protein
LEYTETHGSIQEKRGWRMSKPARNARALLEKEKLALADQALSPPQSDEGEMSI